MKTILSLVLTLFIGGMVYAVSPQDKDISQVSPQQNHEKQLKQDFDKIVKELNITKEQKEQMKQLMESDITKRKELKKQIKEKMQAIDNELEKEKYDNSVIENLATEIEQINSKVLRIGIDGKIKIRNILTFEQYNKMEQYKKQTMKKNKQNKNIK